MAHIPDGVLSAPVIITGAVVSIGLLAVALRRLNERDLPQASVLAAAFFVSSLINVPLGPSSVHLLLNGLMGLLLGWTAVPAILVALVLQAVFFGYGGLLVLGVNTMNLALPALCAWMLLGPRLRGVLGSPTHLSRPRRVFLVGAAAGALGVVLTGVMVAGSLVASGEAFQPAARVIALTFVPLAAIEGVMTGVVVAFLLRVEPTLLAGGGARDG